MYIKIHLYLFVVMAYFFYQGKLTLFGLYYLSAFVHETAHIVVSLLMGVDVKEVVLGPFGVNAKMSGKVSLGKELWISLAGPLLSFFLFLTAREEFIRKVNLLIAFFNLLPIYPLDGGRIQKVVLSMILGKNRGEKISKKVSFIFLIVFILFSIMISIRFANIYFIFFALYLFLLYAKEEKKERFLRIINYLQMEQ